MRRQTKQLCLMVATDLRMRLHFLRYVSVSIPFFGCTPEMFLNHVKASKVRASFSCPIGKGSQEIRLLENINVIVDLIRNANVDFSK